MTTLTLAAALLVALPTSAESPGGDYWIPVDLGSPPDGGPVSHSYVFDRLLLPNSTITAQNYALIYKGTKYNALGNILSVLSTLTSSMDLQTPLDLSVCSGSNLMLLRVEANSLVNQIGAKTQLWEGASQVCCTSPVASSCCAQASVGCFSGSGTVAISATSPQNQIYGGSISSGTMSFGPGQLRLRLDLLSTALTVNLKHATLKGNVTSWGITGGVLAGAISQSDLNTKVMPAVAGMLDTTYKDPYTDASTKNLLKTLFDANSDGSITTAEVMNNTLLKTFLAGDVDVDGDGIKELSLGLGFTAIKATHGGPPPLPDGGVDTLLPPDLAPMVDASPPDLAPMVDMSPDQAAADASADMTAADASADAGADGTPAVDLAPEADTGSGSPIEDRGCDCRMGASPGGAAPVVLTLLLLAGYRRRRR